MVNLYKTGEGTSEELPYTKTTIFQRIFFAIKVPNIPYKIVINNEK